MAENKDNRKLMLNTLETKQSDKPKDPFPQPKAISSSFEKSYD